MTMAVRELMLESDVLTEMLACPRCDQSLIASEAGHRCTGCKVDFPDLDGVPFLFAEPGAALGEWRARLHLELASLDKRAADLATEMAANDLLPTTRDRLHWLADACRDQRRRLKQLMAPLREGGQSATRETYLALRTRLPTDQGLNTYYHNLHRDWAWDGDENDRAFELVASYLPANPGRVLVLGAGAGRLAYDIHCNAGPEQTVALDFNPLLLGCGAKLAAGEEVTLWEFPIAPRSPRQTAVLNTMSAEPAPDGLHFILGDVLRAPFAPGSFDTVITPWLIDILPVDLNELAARINGLLVKGGCWINSGSLAFAQPEHALRFSIPECAEQITARGFVGFQSREDEIPYMCSPASRHGRREIAVTWRADKRDHTKLPARHSALPEWLVTGRDPVPALPSFVSQGAATRIHAFVMSLIDGKRSIRDMAGHMEQQRLMTADEAVGVIRGFLIKMYDDSRRADG